MQVSTSWSARRLERRVAHAVRGHGAQAERVGQVQERLVGGFLLAAPVALDVEEDAAGPERLDDARQPVGVERARARRLERLDARQRHEPAREALQHLEAQPPLALRDAVLHPRDEPAQVSVAALRLDQERQDASTVEAQLRPDDRPDAAGFRRLEEARRTGEAVAVDERHRVVAELRGPLDQVLRQRRPAQEREGRGGVELDGHVFRFLFAYAAQHGKGPLGLTRPLRCELESHPTSGRSVRAAGFRPLAGPRPASVLSASSDDVLRQR